MTRTIKKPGSISVILPIALPLIISSGSNALMQFCDRIFLARLDSVSIQAALPGGVLSFTLCCIFQAIAGYTGTFVAQYHGAGNPYSAKHSTAQGLWLSVLMLPMMMMMVPVGLYIIHISGHEELVTKAENLYFCLLMLGGIFLSLNATLSGYYSGIGRTQVTMTANIAGAVLNVFLDYILIFGKFGCPRMGIAGAAVATVIGVSVPSIVMGALFLRETRGIEGGRRKLFTLDWPLIRRVLRFGVPSGIHLFIDVGAFAAFVMLVGKLPALQFAASNIGFSINHLAFAPLFGVGVAASVVVGQYQGANDSNSAYRAGWSAVKIGLIYISVLGLSFAFLPEMYYSLFGAKGAEYSLEELLSVGRPLMRMLAMWCFFDALNIVIGGALKGAGDTKFVMWYMFIGSWGLWLPGVCVIYKCGGDILAMWRFTAGITMLFSIGFLTRWMMGRWRSIKVIDAPYSHEPPPAPPGSL